jgi:lysophospholipase L1-like esterase
VGSEFGLRINEPGAHYRHKSADTTVWFDINSKGLRADQEYSYSKPEGTLRIVSLGDSFTAGYEVEVEECFSSVLERELNQAGLRVEVLNAGVSGYSTAEALLYLERELVKYEPDLVLISFYSNDFVDNIRTGLFALQDGALIETGEAYVPLGRVGNFLNSNSVFSWLSGYSNAFALFKTTMTHVMKRSMVRQNEQNLELAGSDSANEDPRANYQARLTAALYERLYQECLDLGVPLVIQSIATDSPKGLIELFPLKLFDDERDGIEFVSSQAFLAPYAGKEPLYYRRSNRHWTPFAHLQSGRALAAAILSRQLLR